MMIITAAAVGSHLISMLVRESTEKYCWKQVKLKSRFTNHDRSTKRKHNRFLYNETSLKIYSGLLCKQTRFDLWLLENSLVH